MKDTLFYIFLGITFIVAAIGLGILCMYAPILGIIVAAFIYFVISYFVDHF